MDMSFPPEEFFFLGGGGQISVPRSTDLEVFCITWLELHSVKRKNIVFLLWNYN